MLIEFNKIIKTNLHHLNKELEIIKMTQSTIDNSTSEIKSNLEAMNSWLNYTKEKISDLKEEWKSQNPKSRQNDKQKKQV